MRTIDHHAAYEALLRRYLGPLRRLAYAYASDESEREDLFQEIVLALWIALPGFRGDSSERTWLYRVAHNTAIRYTTRCTRRFRHEQPGEVTNEPVSSADPERTAIDRQHRDHLWAAVRALPLPDRQLIILHLEGLPATEIESITGVSAGNIATRLTRTRQKLAKTIQGEQNK